MGGWVGAQALQRGDELEAREAAVEAREAAVVAREAALTAREAALTASRAAARATHAAAGGGCLSLCLSPAASYSDAKVANRDVKGVGTRRDRKWSFERWTHTKPERRTCSLRYGVPSCRGKSAGVAKRPRERSPTRNP
jgi:hypothetical protein